MYSNALTWHIRLSAFIAGHIFFSTLLITKPRSLVPFSSSLVLRISFLVLVTFLNCQHKYLTFAQWVCNLILLCPTQNAQRISLFLPSAGMTGAPATSLSFHQNARSQVFMYVTSTYWQSPFTNPAFGLFFNSANVFVPLHSSNSAWNGIFVHKETNV